MEFSPTVIFYSFRPQNENIVFDLHDLYSVVFFSTDKILSVISLWDCELQVKTFQ